MAAGMEDTLRSSSSSVLVTGNATVFSRVRALEASRAVISASTRMRSSSSVRSLSPGRGTGARPEQLA